MGALLHGFRRIAIVVLFGAVCDAQAIEVAVVGVFPGKAVIAIDGGAPVTLSVGAVRNGVRLIAVGEQSATLEFDGKRRSLAMGLSYRSKADPNGTDNGSDSVTLQADSKGHFSNNGLINGKSVNFLVDTGATSVSMDINTAKRLGLSYTQGKRGSAQTANGVVNVWTVTLDSVRVGDLTIYQVEGVIVEGAGMGAVLLGNSFLSRTRLKQEGGQMTLTRKF